MSRSQLSSFHNLSINSSLPLSIVQYKHKSITTSFTTDSLAQSGSGIDFANVLLCYISYTKLHVSLNKKPEALWSYYPQPTLFLFCLVRRW